MERDLAASLRTLRDPRVRSVPYTDGELLASGIFEYVKAGFTYPEAVRFAGLDPMIFEHNMSFDEELRYHIVLCSMTESAYAGRARRDMLKILDTVCDRAEAKLRRAA